MAIVRSPWICKRCGAALKMPKWRIEIGQMFFWLVIALMGIIVGLALYFAMAMRIHSGLAILVGTVPCVFITSLLVYAIAPYIRTYRLRDEGVYCWRCSYPIKVWRGACPECGAKAAYMNPEKEKPDV